MLSRPSLALYGHERPIVWPFDGVVWPFSVLLLPFCSLVCPFFGLYGLFIGLLWQNEQLIGLDLYYIGGFLVFFLEVIDPNSFGLVQYCLMSMKNLENTYQVWLQYVMESYPTHFCTS